MNEIKLFGVITVVLLLLISLQPMVVSINSNNKLLSKHRNKDVSLADDSIYPPDGSPLSGGGGNGGDIDMEQQGPIDEWPDPPDPRERTDLSGAGFDVNPDTVTVFDMFDVFYTVQNTGLVEAGAFCVSFYISVDNYITRDDYLLGDATINGLEIDETITDSISLGLPPAGNPFWNGDGEYFVGMRVDSHGNVPETNETNNSNLGPGIDLANITISQTDYIADLYGEFFNVTADVLNASDSFNIDYIIRNGGFGDAGPFDVWFFLSNNSIISSSDFAFGWFGIDGIVVGETFSSSITPRLPAAGDDFWEGNREYYIGMIIDYDQDVIESNETNNSNMGLRIDYDVVEIIRTTELPDLVGIWFNVTEEVLSANDVFEICFEIQNQGNTSVHGFDISLYLSYNDDISHFDKNLRYNTSYYYEIPAGGTTGLINRFFLLPEVGDDCWYGDTFYYIGMIVDSHNEVIESDETNNANRGWQLDFEGAFINETNSNNRGFVDLDVDSDNNNGFLFPERTDIEDSIEEENEKYIVLNNDDDNRNRLLDKFDDGAVTGENDLVPLILEIKPTGGGHLLEPHEAYPYGSGPGGGAPLPSGPDLISYRFRGNWRHDSNPRYNYSGIWRNSDRGYLGMDEIKKDEEYFYQIWILGDYNGNEELDDQDLYLLNQLAIENLTWFDDSWPGIGCEHSYRAVGDMNCDGVIDQKDVIILERAIEYGIIRYVPLRFWMEGIIEKNNREITAEVDFNDNGFDDDPSDEVIIWIWKEYDDTPRGWYSVPPGYEGDDSNPYPRNWRYELYADDPGGEVQEGQQANSPAGYPMSLAMGQGPVPPDFPPKSTDPLSSTVPLVSKETSYFQGPIAYGERPVHNDLIDMMTGQPLLQATDFELPFGGATFRYIRTYSEPYLDQIAQRRTAGLHHVAGSLNGPQLDDARTTYWDWTGQNWMATFNPILLVNASYDELGSYDSDDTTTRYCYFIGDAYHTIPFKQNDDGQFIAPDWFDAVLLHNGNNSIQPTIFWLWLNHNSIKYTFEVHYNGVEFQHVDDDSNGEVWIDTHDPLPGDTTGDGEPDYPSERGEGWGFPFYALVTKIEDRYGNTIEYEYEDNYCQWGCDNPETEDRVEVCQNSNQIGQIKSIKLRTANGTVAWTLLFVYRAFAAKYDTFDDPPWQYPYGGFVPRYTNEAFNQRMIHAVYVYNYDLDTSSGGSFIPEHAQDIDFVQMGTLEDIEAVQLPFSGDNTLLLESDLFTGLTNFDDYDNIDAAELLHLPDDWSIQVEYMYEEADPHWYYDSSNPIPDPPTPYYNYSQIEKNPYWPQEPTWDEWGQVGYNLLKATVTRQFTQPDEVQEYESSRTIYRYEHAPQWRYLLPQSSGRTYLEAVFYDQSIDTIITAKEQELERDLSENIIFELTDDNITVLDDPDTPEDENRSLLDIADINMSCWDKDDVFTGAGNIFTYYEGEPDETSDLFVNLSFFISVEALNQTWISVVARKTLVDNRAESEKNGRFTYYLLKTYPESDPESCGDCYRIPSQDQGWFHTEYHYPYRYASPDLFSDYSLTEIPWDKPFYNMIIDENDPDHEYDPLDKDGDGETGILSRRVVQINPMGWVLSDRTWISNNGSLILDNSSGFWEEREYDENGRVIELRTLGWTAKENQNETDKRYLRNGLVYKYNYSKNQNITVNYVTAGGTPGSYNVFLPGHLRTVAVQQGNGSDQIPYVIEYHERNVPGRPELENTSVKFSDPIPLYDLINKYNWEVNLTAIENLGDVTRYKYDFYPDPLNKDHFYCASIKNKNVTYPAIQQTFNGPMVRAVDWSNISNDGNLVWHGYGNIDENDYPAKDFFVDTYEYDGYGRPTVEVIDANDPKRNSSAPILELTTQHRYDTTWGEIWTKYPDDSERFIVYDRTYSDGKDYIDQWVYDKVVWHGDLWEASVPVAITRLDNYKPIKKMEVTLNDQFHPDAPSADESYTVIANTTVEYDSNGRPISGTRESGETQGVETEKPSLSSLVSYHATGQIERSKKPDGTITRQTYDGLGRLEHKYQGSTDVHPVWRNTDPWNSSTWNDDLVQIEKRYYGTGTNNAGKLITIRHFLNVTSNQYNLIAPPDDPQIPENNEDNIGWTTEYEYDWRMRQVLERENNINGLPIKHQITWYDNLDREILVAVYGEMIGVPSNVDPRYLSSGWHLTSDNISDILDPSEALNGILPLSLTETIYNDRGSSQEIRTYDVFSGRNADYTSTKTFYDHNDNIVESWSQTSVEKSIFNAKNQLISSSTFANTSFGNIEITRTDYVYDDAGREIKNIQWERLDNADISEPLLSDDTSVKTYMYTWYDKAGKVNYTANYGTNNSLGVYISGDEPPYNQDEPIDYEGALITRNGYDEAGKQNVTYNPDGTVKRTEFDDLGREILVIENADDQDRYLRRYTAYFYNNKTGLLEKIAAVLPDHRGHDEVPGISNWSDINWSADDGTLQITETIYDADVVEAGELNMSVLSFDGEDDYVDTADEPFDMGDEDRFTISAWIKTDSKNSRIISKFCDSGPNGGGYELGINEDGKLLLQGMLYSTARNVVGSTLLNDSQWHYVAGTYGGTWPEFGLRVYVDGKEENHHYMSTYQIKTNDLSLQIGRQAMGNLYFSGTMNEVRIYNRSLTAEEIYIMYRGSSISSGLKGYWKMNESYGTIAHDYSGEENDGTIYGATWKDVDKRPISKQPGWISEVRYPDKITGQPSMDDTLKFTYYMDGSIASRRDSKGNTFYYIYDEVGQISETIIDDSYYYDPEGDGVELDYAPQNRIRRIKYTYEADGQISSVTTYNKTNEIISQNNFSYDGMRNPMEEWQELSGSVDIEHTPSIRYEWELSPAETGENFNRLKKIIYPNSQREISFNYDGSDGLDNALCRVSSIEVTEIGKISEYEYAGLCSRVNMTYGDGIVNQNVVNNIGSGYDGLNQFGQIIDLDFKNETDVTIHRYQYGYDLANNRLFANVTQQSPTGFGLVNDRSFKYTYDGLHRLINSSMGQLDANNEYIIPDAPIDLTRFTEWKLDNLGSWGNGTTETGSMIRRDYHETGINAYWVHHEVNNANQIMFITENITISGEPSSIETSQVVYDLGGNLVFDRKYFYQYDGFNHLIQVNEAGDLSADPDPYLSDFDAEGRIKSGSVSKLGAYVVSYVYNGFGRLIQKQNSTITEDYYYDGVRRIQEIFGTEAREYIYGHDYVDEFIGQIDENGNMFYMLQDANYNVMAILDNQGTVLEQYVYDPYGTLAIVNTFSTGDIIVNRVGHQGLFFDNFNSDGLAVDAVGLYYNRNRWYSPILGRFLNRDPNDAAMPIITALAMNGDIMQLAAHAYSLEGQYGDGMNLYQYCGSNPINNRDPSGLWSPTTYVLVKLFGYLASYFGIKIIPPGCTGVISNMIELSIKIFKNWRGIGYDQILVSKIINALKIAIQALKTGITAFINALINVGRIAGSYVLQALRVMGSAGASVLSFLADVAIAAAPYMAVIGVFILAGYAGIKLGEWLSSVVDRLGEQLWEFLYSTSQSIAKSIVAPVMKAAANYASQLDLIMYELETGEDVSPYV